MTKNNTLSWTKEAVIYQIFPERFANGDSTNDPENVVPWDSPPTRENFFGGDLQGVLNKLPYLHDLGITAIYLNPIFKANTNHKYDTCDYLMIDPHFGSEALLKQLVGEAHKLSIKVILDAVFNHCGEGFWAFEDLQVNGEQSKYKDWFFYEALPIQKTPPNYQTCGGTWYLPKLNVQNPEVESYLLKVGQYWIKRTGIDGWRLDVPWKASLDFWPKFQKAVKAANPHAYVIGEVWRGPEEWVNGDMCDGIMNYPLRNAILDYCVYDHMDAEDFDYELKRLLNIYGKTAPLQMNLLGSHDTPRLLTLCNNDSRRVLLALAFMFTFIGIPSIYYGDEIGLTGANDPDCRKTMPWQEQGWNQQLLKFYKAFIKMRKDFPVLCCGGFEPVYIFNGVYAYRRFDDTQDVIVVLNPREERSQVNIPIPAQLAVHLNWKDIFTGEIFRHQQSGIEIDRLESKSFHVLVPERKL
ncbi:MAG TPA: glycoside hydrolase family 13 protein [Anaerolineales bacterium]|nr:glycoside hydrolase family 13 protein [Anaerolineales bacterium]